VVRGPVSAHLLEVRPENVSDEPALADPPELGDSTVPARVFHAADQSRQQGELQWVELGAILIAFGFPRPGL